MIEPLHPLLVELLRKSAASADVAPSLETWQTMLAAVNRMARDDERHRLLFQGNPLPIWVVDAQTLRFLDVNDAMVRTYGYTREELCAMTVADLKPPGDVPEMVRSFREDESGTVRHLGVRTHRCKDGTLLDMDITIHMISYDDRLASLAIARDTTRARKLEEDLRQAQKMEAIGQLAGGVAHDFNNILGVILANAEFGIEELADGVGREQFEEIRASAERGAGLTRQLLTFSRKQKRQLQPIALNAVVTGLEAMLTRIVGEDIAMSARIAPDLGTIEADRGEVEQVLMNLVVNARDAMPEGGILALKTTNAHVGAAQAAPLGIAPGRYVVLTVSDTGCGMTPDVQARIFEPFFTTKDVNKGTGLGLATVFGIVKQSGGGIDVSSEPGHGTSFQVYWPRVDAVASLSVQAAFVAPRATGTVLLVEDDRQLRGILARYLTSWGYTLLEAMNGKAALELVRGYAGQIDVVLTDLVMPGLDGRSLSRQVLLEKPHAKIVFMSGHTEHAQIKNAALGPNDLVMQKPFTAQTLSETLRRALCL